MIVGVNRYTVEEEAPMHLLEVDPELVRRQVQRLEAYKGARDSAEVERSLGKLSRAAEREVNLMPPILEALEARATNGEISSTLREVFGEYRATTIV